MKKTYVTTMPNQIGAFLKASRCFAELGVNITRVSYNKAIDSHTLFIEAQGTEEQLLQADEKLEKIGYLQNDAGRKNIVLIEFRLHDVPGSVTAVLQLINEYNFNISYISSQENGTDYQLFKMGLFVDDPKRVALFLQAAEKLCRVRVINYNHTEKFFDNSIFYNSFVSGLAQTMGLSQEDSRDLMINTNLAMQTLDEGGLSPYRTFDSIGRFTDLLAKCRGTAFAPRITVWNITDSTKIILVEPPCGSNTAIIVSGEEVLFMDCGYALYREEMLQIYRQLVPDFDFRRKKIFLTHADVDHCGLLNLFDDIYCSYKSAWSLTREAEDKDGYRELNHLHRPYVRICKILTGYKPVDPGKLRVIGGDDKPLTQSFLKTGNLSCGELQFELYEGQGGHLPGENMLVDHGHHLIFSGDIFINLKGLTAEQAAYNQYAPVLMTSVDSNPQMSRQERQALKNMLGEEKWTIYGAHGAPAVLK